MANPFALPGQWYKGNLHTHSNQSDGEASPQQLVDMFAERGYDFLAITDHLKLTDPAALDSKGLLLLPGSELHGGAAELGQHYHIVALGLSAPVEYPAAASAQDIINAAREVAEFCFVAHPSWSSLTFADLLPLEGHLGIEVYNTTCHHGIGRGVSSVQWDDLLGRGQRLLGFAVDDAHLHYPDALGGWVMVKAEACTTEALLAALQDGHFYASTGPVFESLTLTADRLQVRCSPVQEIRMICPKAGHGNTSFRLGRPGPYTEAEFGLRPEWGVVRVEIMDDQGRFAWSNPFWLQDEA